jgi:hypothetical protein
MNYLVKMYLKGGWPFVARIAMTMDTIWVFPLQVAMLIAGGVVPIP